MDPINEYHLLLTCDMMGVTVPRVRLTAAVVAAVGDWAGAGTQDETAGRLLGADGVWANAPPNLPQGARAAVTTATIAFLASMAVECWATRGHPASGISAPALGGGAPALPSTAGGAGANGGAGPDGPNSSASDSDHDDDGDSEDDGSEDEVDDVGTDNDEDGSSDSESASSAQRQLLEDDMDELLSEIDA